MQPPQHFHGPALEEWNRITAALSGRLCEVDRQTVVRCCEHWVHLMWCKALEQNAIVGTPAHRQARLGRREAEAAWAARMKQLGLTPVERPRVRTY